jgi:Zn-dependent protease with chaperone function
VLFMTFVRRSMLLLGSAVFLAILTPLPLAAQSALASSAVSSAPANPQPGNPRQAYSLPPDKLAKAIALSRIENILAIAGSLWGIAVLWLLLATRAAAQIEAWAIRTAGRRWVQGILFFALFFVITTLAGLPLDLYAHHVSRSFGISVQGWGSWFGDQAKSLAVTLLIGAPVLLLFNWIVRRWPRRYWFGVWLVSLPLILISVFAEPVLIDPLFNKFEPLQNNHAALVTKLELVVARTGIDIPPNRMYLMKASVKYNGINAYVTGIGQTKRFVMWDTATDRLPDDEVLFIFGHESGHYVLHHIPKGLAGGAVGLFFVYWACSAFAAWLIRRFGVRWNAPDLASRTGFVVLLFAVSLAGFLLEPASNAFSRHFEHQADVYGQEAIHGIVPDPQKTTVAAFNDLGAAWLDDPSPSPFIEFWLYNHPSTQNRANFAAHYDPWANGGRGEFFSK